jgi:hypothetical protein
VGGLVGSRFCSRVKCADIFKKLIVALGLGLVADYG